MTSSKQEYSNDYKMYIIDDLSWIPIKHEFLDLEYCSIMSEKSAWRVYTLCELYIVYPDENSMKLSVAGKINKSSIYRHFPRKQIAFGDKDISYTYSGFTLKANPWPLFLLPIKEYVEKVCQCTFNYVLINRYKDGGDYVAFHKDDELDIEEDSIIASLSFGSSREFIFQRFSTSDHKLSVNMILGNGSLLLMKPPTNHFWSHSLPRAPFVTLPRINMTFRKIKTN